MDGWIIALIAVVSIVILLIVGIWLIKRIIKNKIKNKLIDLGAEIIKNTTENALDEKTAGSVNEAADITAKFLKSGKRGLLSAAIKKAKEIKKNKKAAKQNPPSILP